MKMSYLATNKKTKESYGICCADPYIVVHCVSEIKRWIREDAIIELLPTDVAKERFCLGKQKKEDKQLELFCD